MARKRNDQFSVKSMYNSIINFNVRIRKRILWEVIFMSSNWLHSWCMILSQKQLYTMRISATRLEFVAKEFLSLFGWGSPYKNSC
uniref:Uncharacterized protein n=1 Tax=Oryza punctata TaxID=4537 RepID=A0A0E0KNR9_ORYPU